MNSLKEFLGVTILIAAFYGAILTWFVVLPMVGLLWCVGWLN